MQKNILIIDDELFFREFISDNLKKAGYFSIASSSGAGGLSTLEKEKGKVSVIMLDMSMPEMDGLTVLDKIKEINPDIPVIMMTAHTDQDLVMLALKNGAFDYLVKPLYTEELLLSAKRAYDHYHLVIENENKLRQLKNLETGAQRLGDLTKGSMRMETVVENNKLLQSAIDLIASVLEAEKVSMMLVDMEKRQLRVVVANWTDRDLSRLPVLKIGEGIAGKVAESGEAILVRDLKDAKEFKESQYSGQYKTSSFLCVPVKAMGKTIGVISVNDKLTGESFTESDLTVLTTFSYQIALSLENAMVNADMERYIEKLNLLNDISKTLITMVEPKDIFKDIVKKTRDVLEVEACTLLLSDELTGELRFEAGFGEKGEIKQELSVKPGLGVIGNVLKTGKTAVVPSVKDEKMYAKDIDGVPGVEARELICTPLKIKDMTLGVIKSINKKSRQPVGKRDIELMETIASHASIALKNAWLYQNLTSSVDEVAETNKELERVNNELNLKIKELELLKKGKG